MAETKRCSKCGEHKPLDAFPTDRSRRSGLYPYCKACHIGLAIQRRVDQYGPAQREARQNAIYSVNALASETGVSPRTIRYYIEKRLIPPAYPRVSTSANDIRHGSDLRYGVEHLRAIRKIREIRDGNVTLADIRDRLYPEDA